MVTNTGAKRTVNTEKISDFLELYFKNYILADILPNHGIIACYAIAQ